VECQPYTPCAARTGFDFAPVRHFGHAGHPNPAPWDPNPQPWDADCAPHQRGNRPRIRDRIRQLDRPGSGRGSAARIPRIQERISKAERQGRRLGSARPLYPLSNGSAAKEKTHSRMPPPIRNQSNPASRRPRLYSIFAEYLPRFYCFNCVVEVLLPNVIGKQQRCRVLSSSKSDGCLPVFQQHRKYPLPTERHLMY
jgi:hypothetical protein